MTRTITIFFDTTDSSDLGYAVQHDIHGNPGMAAEAPVSLTSARRCATGAKPPAAVVAAARKELGLVRTPIVWARYDGDAQGWTGTFRTRA